ncbi:hypothetical protein Purlil1_5783 [Purpureocillium lilacinum]|uniref:Uncharacterized protein n=1 Tax=Purpureocillium lilacinum TaxID=33203 RepID=A0ABR0C0F2_PURLI|nr:hypothetical protein Purlil1_5783 [Purpureocillium lilacinum]
MDKSYYHRITRRGTTRPAHRHIFALFIGAATQLAPGWEGGFGRRFENMRPLQGWRGKNEGKKVQGVRMNPDPGLTSPWSPSLSLSVHIARTRYVPLDTIRSVIIRHRGPVNERHTGSCAIIAQTLIANEAFSAHPRPGRPPCLPCPAPSPPSEEEPPPVPSPGLRFPAGRRGRDGDPDARPRGGGGGGQGGGETAYEPGLKDDDGHMAYPSMVHPAKGEAKQPG